MKIKDNIPYCTINGLHISQTPKVIKEFLKIIKNFDIIIEIGYYRGGLTQFFAEASNDNCKVFAFDISDEQRINQNFEFSKKITFIVENCFSEKAIELIKSIIKNNKTLIFCDGGNKPKEFNLFSSLLKEYDHIMVHDFFDGNGVYASGIDWPHSEECLLKDIEEAVKIHNLSQFNYDNFKFNLIGSFIKCKKEY